MTNIPNQTQIEPSAEAIEASLKVEWPKWERMPESVHRILRASRMNDLSAAYAIDLTPIIAERDRMKAALEEIQDRACDGNVDHYMADFIYDACRAALKGKP